MSKAKSTAVAPTDNGAKQRNGTANGTANGNNNNNNNSTKTQKQEKPVKTPYSEAPSSDDEKQKAPVEEQKKDNSEKVTIGITADKKRFVVPETCSCVESMLRSDMHTKFANQVIFGGIAAMFLATYMFSLPRWFFMVVFFFWRFAYNVGLGAILYYQSNYRSFSKFFQRYISSRSNKQFFEKNVSLKDSKTYRVKDYPTDYNAWLAFRSVVDIILVSDFFCYCIFALAYIEFPETIGIKEVLMYAAGVVLCLFNVWAKSDAHRVIGDFAWYWGDFFFLIEKDLVFDGIFQMFPHPMYTVGYAFYYGSALISRSYTVLYVSVIAHICQLLFLVLVESPHIEKTYGAMTETTPEKELVDKVLYDSASGYFHKKDDLIIFFNLDLYRESDIFLILITIYNVVLYFLNLSPWFYFGQVVFWRLFHTVFLGVILHKQSKYQSWTKHYLKKGRSKQQAFESWKRLYNMSLTINHVVFCIFARSMFSWPETWSTGSFAVKQIAGVALICLNCWSSLSTYEVLGDYGWFYGDFFIDEIPSKLHYTGIYRYLNNPDSVMGFAAYYGLALLSGSWLVGLTALFSQICSLMFDRFVEKPHMKALYEDKIRKHGGLQAELTNKMKKIKDEIVHSPKIEFAKITEEITHSLKLEGKKVTDQIAQKIAQMRRPASSENLN